MGLSDEGGRASAIWIDLANLAYPSSITGVERAMLELIRCIYRRPEIRLCAFDPQIGAFVQIQAEELLLRCSTADQCEKPNERIATAIKKRIAPLVPHVIRHRFAPERRPAQYSGTIVARFRPDEILVELGAFWYAHDHVPRLTAVCKQYRLRLALMVHDLFPLLFPHWFPGFYSPWWSTSLVALLREVRVLFANSHSTAGQLESLAERTGLSLAEINVLTYGTPTLVERGAGEPLTQLPTAYVLTVGSIAARKNPMALLSVWSRLIRECGLGKTPALIFAGRADNKMPEFRAALRRNPQLESKVRFIATPSDRQLAQLYRGCQFTVFPSLAEGWGFPVDESLFYGKACLASDSDAIREVGGELVGYFDPRDQESMYQTVRAFILDAGERTRRENRIRAQYRQRSWESTAGSFLRALSAPPLVERRLFEGRGGREKGA